VMRRISMVARDELVAAVADRYARRNGASSSITEVSERGFSAPAPRRS